ncbi:MAG: alpha/beta hydrolase [Bacilli bacterium]|nr:alpha/beta hydrolase [Bacilli bacterium]
MGRGKDNVLFLHGWGCTKEIYQQNINYISQFMTVYALDFPGFGKSDEPTYVWSIDDYVDLVIQFINTLDIKKISLIGHSFGGKVIIKLVNRKDLNFKIDKIVLISSAGIKHDRKPTFRQKIYKIVFPIVKKISLKLLNKIKTKVGSTDYRCATPMMRDILVKHIHEDLKDLLPSINKPTLIIWGEKDEAVPYSDALYMAQHIKDSGIVNLENSGHFPFLDNPYLINKVLESFLKKD